MTTGRAFSEAECWEKIRKLKGETLRTLRDKNPFDVIEVTEKWVVIVVRARGKERKIPKKEILCACKKLHEEGSITRIRIEAECSPRNPAFVAAMLASDDGVAYTDKPVIKLWLKR